MFKLLPKWLLCYRPEVCFTITYQKAGELNCKINIHSAYPRKNNWDSVQLQVETPSFVRAEIRVEQAIKQSDAKSKTEESSAAGKVKSRYLSTKKRVK